MGQEILEQTIPGYLTKIFREYEKKPAMIASGESFSYGELEEVSRDLALGLLSLGLKKGDRVGLWGNNSNAWLIAMLGVLRMGGVVLPIDPNISMEDLTYILKDSGARALIYSMKAADGKAFGWIEGINDLLPTMMSICIEKEGGSMALSMGHVIGSGSERSMRLLLEMNDLISPRDECFLMYTSGTTGRPKGVMLDHRGLLNKAYYSNKAMGLRHMDRLSLFFPLFHMFGNTCIALCGLIAGASLVIPCPVFDPERINNAIGSEGITSIYGSPNMFLNLLGHSSFSKQAWKRLNKGIIGGASCPEPLMKRLVLDLGIEGICVGYGITEACSWVSMTRPRDPIEIRLKSVGRPLECCEVRIVDPGSGSDMGINSQGEVITRGFLMKGYHNMPAATRAALDTEGWFNTGDLGRIDGEGYLYIQGRLKDVIVREGVEIYPIELEEALMRIPDVLEAQAVGIPDPQKGQEIAVFVRLKEGSVLGIKEIWEHMEKGVNIKTDPRFYRIIKEFPVTRSGKVKKYVLRELLTKS